MTGLIDSTTGLAFGTGLQWQTAIGGDGLQNVTTPSWVLQAGGLPATMDADVVNDRVWNAGALTSVTALFATSRASTGYYGKADGTLVGFLPQTVRYGTAGLLPEGASTNLFPTSLLTQDFSDAVWQDIHISVTDNATTAPDGSNAGLLTATASGAFGSYIGQTIGTLSGTACLSVYLKKGNQRYIFLDLYGGPDNVAVFDLDTASYVGNGGQGTTTRQGIDTLANGWFRCWLSMDGLASAAYNCVFGFSSGNNVTSVSGDSMYAWGIQAEATPRPTSYMPVKNYANYSEDYTNAYWTKESSFAIANAAIGPNGAMTASKLEEDSDDVTPNSHEFFRTLSVSLTEGNHYTLSWYAKAAERRYVSLHMNNLGAFDRYVANVVDLQTGTVTQTGQGSTDEIVYVGSTVVDVGNGWYRISLTCFTATYPIESFGVSTTNGPTPGFFGFGATTRYVGVLGWGAYFTGAQLERTAAPTIYWTTTDVTNARAADVLTFSNLTWFDGTQDSIYAEWVAQNVNNSAVWAFDATNNKLLDEQTGMSPRIAGATVANTAAAGATVKVAARLKLNDFAITMNGGTVAADTSETAPGTLTASRLGVDLAGANALNGYIHRVAAFKGSALANGALQTLST